MEAITFDIIRSAVNLARFENVRRLDTIRARLKVEYPGQDENIEVAIKYWAEYEAKKPQNRH